jgi:hypothetical protein
MNIKQLNQLPIKEFLDKIGIAASYQNGESYWYISPIRGRENSPSFKVNMALNRWYDYGIMQGGKLFDLAQRLDPNLDVSCLIEKINGLFLFEQQNPGVRLFSVPIQPCVTAESNKTPAVVIKEIKPLGNNPAISSYLQNRGIAVDLARRYSKEVYYQIGEKQYFAAGFENRSGGYELRSRYFKGSSSPKDITYIENGGKSICVLEGFMDFLSLLTLQKNRRPVHSDFLVLNSVSLVDRSLDILAGYRNAFLYLDHDDAGKRVQEKYQLAGLKTVDASGIYQGYKDLNEYLINQKPVQKEVKQRQEYKKSQGLGM